jgi:non-heme chloroperoxidase
MPMFATSDCELYYDDAGSGRPIVFIHGLTVTSRFFLKQRPFISERNRFVAPDIRSHGRSEKVLHGNTVPIQSRDLHELFEGLDLRDMVLVGWSNGAFNVWEYLHTFGDERVAGVVIVDESPCPVKRPDWDLGYFELPALAAGMEARQVDHEAFVRNVFLQRIFAKPPPPDDVEWMVEEITAIPGTIAAAVGFDSMTRDYRPLLEDVHVPVLVCFGAESIVPEGNGPYLSKAMGDARLVVIEGSGHSPFYEQPDRFNDELARFVASLPATGE